MPVKDLDLNSLPVSSSVWGPRATRITHTSTDPTNTDSSCLATLHQMAHLVIDSCNDLQYQSFVCSQILNNQSHLSTRDIARCAFWWSKHHIKYTEDEMIMRDQLGIGLDQIDKDLLIAPKVLVTMPYPMGDCDDFAMFIGSVLKYCERPSYFVVIAADRFEPFRFSHVYNMTTLENGQPYYIDGAFGKYPGWSAEVDNQITVNRKMEWRVS